MKRLVATLAALAAMCLLLWFFPLFHVVRRGTSSAGTAASNFNATDFAQEFWDTKLTPAFDQAADAATVLAALQNDPQQAQSEYGHSAGLGRTVLYFVRGRGRITAVSGKSIDVILVESGDQVDDDQADVALQTGLLFGNTVRDATALIDGSDFANSQQFNEISTALNQIVESTVLPTLKQQAQVGRAIEFVGCAEVTNLPRDASPLQVIPVQVRFPE
jgi:predicted lipoprotein